MTLSAYLRIGQQVFVREIDTFPKDLAILFTEQERRVKKAEVSSESSLLGEKTKDSRLFEQTAYVSSRSAICNRLDFLGFTLETAGMIFERQRLQEIEQIKDLKERLSNNTVVSPEKYRQYIEHETERSDGWKRLSFPSWLESLRDPTAHLHEAIYHPIVNVSASESLHPDRFPGSVDPRFHLRCELEISSEQEVVLDISEWYEAFQTDDISWCSEDVGPRDRSALRLIVLTEGTTDTWILKKAIALLCPDLCHFLSFLEFDSARLDGETSYLTKMVKAFAGAGIRDRVVAVFDNDTAGSLALAQLATLKLPKNVRAIQGPAIDIARQYPTLGPTGMTLMDINGRACSIELYLGSDVLSTEQGYMPVQWTGYEAKMERYQGEILNKAHCLSKFKAKVAATDSLRAQFDPSWSELRLLIRAITNAFVEVDRNLLLDEARDIRNA